ncbi:MAG: NAD(P)-dependent oxidoreductase [Desulfovibrionales bacterium]|nr:NAD(P)-dependent oxidoreductase [Desulfovibrionales bacterium]
MSKPKLLYYSILKYQADNLKLLNDKFDVVEVANPSFDNEDILSTIDVLLAPMGYYLDKNKIDKCLNLKVIGSNTTGHPHIDVDYACSKGIEVVTLKNQKEFLDSITPTAEHTWGLLIALTRNLIPAYKYALDGQWDRRPFGGAKMLSRMKIGVVGLGRLGFKVAQYALAFGMDVFYFDPFVFSGLPGLVSCSSLEGLVAQVDVVTVHVPHEKETEGMFSARVFSEFKEGAYFINTSRGELVDHSALLEYLKSGHLAGAVLDVFDGEFVPGFQKTFKDHPLLAYAKANSNLIITPHIGGSTYDAWYETERFTINSIIDKLTKKQKCNGIQLCNNEAWAFIPARGGSKSIPLKNMVHLNGKPLISYAIEAGMSASMITRMICSTDSEEISNYCQMRKIEVQPRPTHLSRDNVPTVDVIMYFLETIKQKEERLPEFLVLLEPTSPFVTERDIEMCIHALKNDPGADSAQTVTPVSSNSHAYNQRYHDDHGSHFLFMKERKVCINKQMKPEFFIHGNVRVMRVSSLINSGDLFGAKSIPIPISRLRAMDVDGPDDLVIAESIIKSGLLS